MRVLVDLHGGDPDDVLAKAEYTEIKERVMFEVGKLFLKCTLVLLTRPQRESGEGRTYAVMWKRYKRRVLLAMSSQAFAQLVSGFHVQKLENRSLTPWYFVRMVLMSYLTTHVSIIFIA